MCDWAVPLCTPALLAFRCRSWSRPPGWSGVPVSRSCFSPPPPPRSFVWSRPLSSLGVGTSLLPNRFRSLAVEWPPPPAGSTDRPTDARWGTLERVLPRLSMGGICSSDGQVPQVSRRVSASETLSTREHHVRPGAAGERRTSPWCRLLLVRASRRTSSTSCREIRTRPVTYAHSPAAPLARTRCTEPDPLSLGLG